LGGASLKGLSRSSNLRAQASRCMPMGHVVGLGLEVETHGTEPVECRPLVCAQRLKAFQGLCATGSVDDTFERDHSIVTESRARASIYESSASCARDRQHEMEYPDFAA